MKKETHKNFKYTSLNDFKKIPNHKYLVYALKAGEDYIVLGHGRKNRAKVIYDNINNITYSHLKSFKVRLYILFRSHLKYSSEIIICEDKKTAWELEKLLHKEYTKSNTNDLITEFKSDLEPSWKEHRDVELLLKIALNSSNSGLNDIKKWHRKKIIRERDYKIIKSILKLDRVSG